MKNILIATIGNRDVQIEEDGHLNIISPCRIEGEALYRKLKDDWEKVRIPLISETLKYIQHDSGALNKVFLIVTDQSNLQFSQKDTVWFGKIISALLRSPDYAGFRKRSGFGELKINNVEIITLSEYVKDFHGNFALFSRKFSEFKDKQDDIDKIYIEYTGGIPEINYALVLAAIFLLDREKIRAIGVDETIAGSSARETAIIRNLGKEIGRVQLAVNLLSYDYRSPLHSIALDPPIEEALRMLACRLDFDFEGARFHLQKLCSLDRELHEKIDGLLEAKSGSDMRLAEIYYQMEIKLKSGSYLDFLSRLYCFYENYWQFLLVEKGYQVSELNTEKERNAAHEKYLSQNPELHAFLKNDPFYKDKEIKASTKFNFLASKYFYGDAFKAIEPIGKRLAQLVELRNRTAIAHRLDGVSREDFEKLYESDFINRILKDLENLLNFAGIAIKDKNIFTITNGVIMAWLHDH
jgi:hypothetical protein